MTRHEQLVDRGREIIQAAPQAYIDLDVEADGPAGYGSLLSIGAVSPWGEEFYAELKPSRETFVPRARKFCEEHDLQRERLMEEGRRPDEALAELAIWAADLTQEHGKKRSVLTAFNASYDFAHIDLAMLENDVKSPFGIAGFCTKSLALALRPGYDWTETSKHNLPQDLLPPGEFTHNALEDAVYQQQTHFGMAAMLEALRGEYTPE